MSPPLSNKFRPFCFVMYWRNCATPTSWSSRRGTSTWYIGIGRKTRTNVKKNSGFLLPFHHWKLNGHSIQRSITDDCWVSMVVQFSLFREACTVSCMSVDLSQNIKSSRVRLFDINSEKNCRFRTTGRIQLAREQVLGGNSCQKASCARWWWMGVPRHGGVWITTWRDSTMSSSSLVL